MRASEPPVLVLVPGLLTFIFQGLFLRGLVSIGFNFLVLVTDSKFSRPISIWF